MEAKRIPKKNIKDFCGKPIIAYSIEAALDSGIFDCNTNPVTQNHCHHEGKVAYWENHR